MHLKLVFLWLVLVGIGCGSRTDAVRSIDGGAPPLVQAERCNGIDDDGINGVDDPFRDPQGRYVGDANCGACGQVCAPRSAAELVTHCTVVGELPLCVAQACATGTAPTREGRCVSLSTSLCLPCANDNDCGALAGAHCGRIANESRCSIDCKLGCPTGYQCDSKAGVCAPVGGSCSCGAADSFQLACATDSAVMRDAGAPVCVGQATCSKGVLSACQTSVEVCDHDDNDCDGVIDEGFADARGAYSLSQANCGECGVSCLEDTGTDMQLACGGDPFAPTCTLACPDARDGIMVGDMLDGDLDIATGCECKVSALRDDPGPQAAKDAAIDVNCDGADGVVLASFYVATDGDDSFAGSPTRPLRTINAAIKRASTSLGTPFPRPHVFVAAGTYAETISLADGVLVHGGYRRDFRALDPSAFLVDVRAPALTLAPGGAALIASNVGVNNTLLEGMSLLGLDAITPAAATLAAYLERPQVNLTLRNLTLRAGIPGEGVLGADGVAGSPPRTLAQVGELPRGAVEQGTMHPCMRSQTNVVAGGGGGQNSCGGVDVAGGAGGQSTCPVPGSPQASGESGHVAAGKAASGGRGGDDSRGPISGEGSGCKAEVCCGLADFSVANDFQGPSAGQNGGDGTVGSAGVGCADARGSFSGGTWNGARGSAGSDGTPGAGGGGGGAGGGVLMDFRAGLCEFADGLGGGGGGGGAAGCGGGAGRAGTSGGPSLALLTVEPAAFTIDSVSFQPARGGRGGPGGAGGDGALGGVGANGGLIAPELRTTPTLAGTFPGARGGSGGAGGPGGGGGGGCGGSSIGIWVVGSAPSNAASWRAQNQFALGSGGEGGAGGGGARVGSDGVHGEALDVVVQQ